MIPHRTLGRTGPTVSAIGLGCMGLSDSYGPADEDQSIALIRAAVERGVCLLDTGDFYGMGHNEMLIGRAIRGLPRERIVLSVKFGALRGPDGGWTGTDNRRAAVRNFVAYTLNRLGVDYIDIYRPARLDPAVPIEETAEAVAELIREGYVRHLGLSEVGPETIRRAHAITPVSDLQIEYSLMTRGLERAILPTLRELGIGLTAYGVLSRGLIADAAPDPTAGFRVRMPRFQGENLQANRKLVEALASIARDKGVSTSQLAIAWAASRGDDIVPLVGTRRLERLDEALAALAISLSPDDLARIDAAVPAYAVAGSRYDAHQMAALDSER